jgi:hypothetical protein
MPITIQYTPFELPYNIQELQTKYPSKDQQDTLGNFKNITVDFFNFLKQNDVKIEKPRILSLGNLMQHEKQISKVVNKIVTSEPLFEFGDLHFVSEHLYNLTQTHDIALKFSFVPSSVDKAINDNNVDLIRLEVENIHGNSNKRYFNFETKDLLTWTEVTPKGGAKSISSLHKKYCSNH